MAQIVGLVEAGFGLGSSPRGAEALADMEQGTKNTVAVMEQTGERAIAKRSGRALQEMAILLAIRSRLINEKRKGVLWVFWAKNMPASTARGTNGRAFGLALSTRGTICPVFRCHRLVQACRCRAFLGAIVEQGGPSRKWRADVLEDHVDG